MNSHITQVVKFVEQFFNKVLLDKVKGDSKIMTEWKYFNELLLSPSFDFHRIQTYIDILSNKQEDIPKNRSSSYSVYNNYSNKPSEEPSQGRYSDLSYPQSFSCQESQESNNLRRQEAQSKHPNAQRNIFNSYSQQQKQATSQQDFGQQSQQHYTNSFKFTTQNSVQTNQLESQQSKQQEKENLKKQDFSQMENQQTNCHQEIGNNTSSGKLIFAEDFEESADLQGDNSDGECTNEENNNLLLLIEKKYFDGNILIDRKTPKSNGIPLSSRRRENQADTSLQLNDIQNFDNQMRPVLEEVSSNSIRNRNRNRILSLNQQSSSNSYLSSQSMTKKALNKPQQIQLISNSIATSQKSQANKENFPTAKPTFQELTNSSKDYNPNISMQNYNSSSQNQNQSISLNQSHSQYQQNSINQSYNNSQNHQISTAPTVSINQDQSYNACKEQLSPLNHQTNQQSSKQVEYAQNNVVKSEKSNGDNYNFNFKISPNTGGSSNCSVSNNYSNISVNSNHLTARIKNAPYLVDNQINDLTPPSGIEGKPLFKQQKYQQAQQPSNNNKSQQSIQLNTSYNNNKSTEHTPKQIEQELSSRSSIPFKNNDNISFDLIKIPASTSPALNPNQIQLTNNSNPINNIPISPSQINEQPSKKLQETQKYNQLQNNQTKLLSDLPKTRKINCECLALSVSSAINIMNSNNLSIQELLSQLGKQETTQSIQQSKYQHLKQIQSRNPQPFKVLTNIPPPTFSPNISISGSTGNGSQPIYIGTRPAGSNQINVQSKNNPNMNSNYLPNDENTNPLASTINRIPQFQNKGMFKANNITFKAQINSNFYLPSQFISQQTNPQPQSSLPQNSTVVNNSNNNIPVQNQIPSLPRSQQQQYQVQQQQSYPQLSQIPFTQQDQHLQQISNNTISFCQQPYIQGSNQQVFQPMTQPPIRQTSLPHQTQVVPNPFISIDSNNQSLSIKQQQTRSISALARDTRSNSILTSSSNQNIINQQNTSSSNSGNSTLAPPPQVPSASSYKRLKTIDCTSGSSISNRPLNSNSFHTNNNTIDSRANCKPLNRTFEDQLNSSLGTNDHHSSNGLQKCIDLSSINKRGEYQFIDMTPFNINSRR